MMTTFDCEITSNTLANYFGVLIGKVFKILPLAEDSRQSAKVYLEGFSIELMGLQDLFQVIGSDPMFVSFLSIINWLANNIEDEGCALSLIKREVFEAIHICKKIEESIEDIVGGDAGE